MMYDSGETAWAAPVIDLCQRRQDLEFFSLITDIKHVETDGIEAEIRIATAGPVPDSWLRTLRVRLTHMTTGRKANGKLNNAAVVSRSDSGITVKVKPLLPGMGKIGREHFRVDITTASGLKKTLICVASADKSVPKSERMAASDLFSENAGPHVCRIIPFRKRPPRRRSVTC